jgi:type IV fimbrial biogenesis protein FimT
LLVDAFGGLVISKQLKFQSVGNELGFSLIELMMVISVLGILLMVGAPSLRNLIADNRLLSEVFALRATLNNARTKALSQRSFVTVCRSGDGAACNGSWNQGYIAFTDFDGDGVLDPNSALGNDTMIQAKVLDNSTLDITYSNGANRIRFNSRGNALGFSGTIKICDDRGPEKARGMVVSNVGSVQALVDSDDPKNGIVNLQGGSDVACP